MLWQSSIETSTDTFRYLNFDKMQSYTDKADTVILQV